jgi:hypothetical protein
MPVRYQLRIIMFALRPIVPAMLLCAGLSSVVLDSFAQTAPPASSAPNVASAPASAPSTAAAPPSSPSSIRSFKETIRDAREYRGLFTLYQRDDRVWIEIRPEQFEQPFFFALNVASSIGENGLHAGERGKNWHAVFRRNGVSVQLIARNMQFVAPSNTPESAVVRQGFSDSLLASTVIASLPDPETRAVLIDASAVFLTDIPAYGLRLEHVYRQSYNFDKFNSSFNRVYAESGHSGLLVNAHYYAPKLALSSSSSSSTAPQPTISGLLPDPRSLFVGFYYSLSALPAQVMRSRPADERIGHFVTTSEDLGSDTKPKTTRHIVHRWRLEKADPDAHLSEPKQPIVYWIDKNVPQKYRKSVTEGVLEWNKAFEKIGFKKAIVVKQQTELDFFHTLDSRHASIRWYAHQGTQISMGPLMVDARSGEILDADIVIADGATRGVRRQSSLSMPLVSGQQAYPPAHPHEHDSQVACEYASQSSKETQI